MVRCDFDLSTHIGYNGPLKPAIVGHLGLVHRNVVLGWWSTDCEFQRQGHTFSICLLLPLYEACFPLLSKPFVLNHQNQGFLR